MSPQAQRVAGGVLNDESRQASAVSRQQEQSADDQRDAVEEQQEQAERIQKEAQREQEESQRRSVRAGQAAGQETHTDIDSGRTVLSQHEDGAPKFRPGAVGAPVEKPVENPGLGPVAPKTATDIYQSYRDDRGNVTQRPLSQTDEKTGEIFAEVEDPATGQKTRQVLGVDTRLQEKIERQGKIDQQRGNLDLAEAEVKAARFRINPQWEPVERDFNDATRAWESFPKTFRRNTNTGAMEKIDPKTDLPVPYGAGELAVWQRDREAAQTRYARAMQAHDGMRPQVEGIAAREREIQEANLRLNIEQERLKNDLPAEDGGAAEAMARQTMGLPPVAGVEAVNELVGPPVPMEEWSPSPPKPLIPRDAEGDKVFASAFAGLANPEKFKVSDTANGFAYIQRDGRDIGKLERTQDGGAAVVLNGDWANEDLRGTAAVGNLTGIPVYLADSGKRKPIIEEKKWAASLFQAASTHLASSPEDDQEQRTAAIRQLGGAPMDIISKVKTGEISHQTGESIMRDLYGASLKVEDPLSPQAFRQYLHGSADARKKWAQATANRSVDEKNAVRGEFVNDWFARNQGMPGVTWGMQEKARKQLTGESAQGYDAFRDAMQTAGGFVRDTAASMAGLIAKYPTLGALRVGGLVSEDAKEGADWMSEVTGRANQNFLNGVDFNFKKWATPEGKELMTGYEAAGGALRSLIATADSFGGMQSPEFQKRFAAALKEDGDAAFRLHQMSQEEGWHTTREDLDPMKDKALGVALFGFLETGDPAQWNAYRRRLLMDKGSRQAELQMDDATRDLGPFAKAFMSGVLATDAEAGIELVTTALSYGTAKAISVGAKAAKVVEGTAAVSGAASRMTRAARYGQRLGQEFRALGKLEDTLAKPAGQLGKAYNKGVDLVKAAPVEMTGEAFQEGLAELGNREATANSVLESAGLGALGGLVMFPLMGIPGSISGAAQATRDRRVAVGKFTDWYNRTMMDTEGFTPLKPTDTEAAAAILNPEAQAAKVAALQEAGAEVQRITQALANDSASPLLSADQQAVMTESLPSQYSNAVARMIEADADLTNTTMGMVEAVQYATKQTGRAKDELLGVLKVANGRESLLTEGERRAVSGKLTADGQPYFANVGGRSYVTDAARAELLAKHGLVASRIQTTESMALFEALTPTPETNETSQPTNNERTSPEQLGSGERPSNSISPDPSAAQRGGGTDDSGGGNFPQAQGLGPQAAGKRVFVDDEGAVPDASTTASTDAFSENAPPENSGADERPSVRAGDDLPPGPAQPEAPEAQDEAGAAETLGAFHQKAVEAAGTPEWNNLSRPVGAVAAGDKLTIHVADNPRLGGTKRIKGTATVVRTNGRTAMVMPDPELEAQLPVSGEFAISLPTGLGPAFGNGWVSVAEKASEAGGAQPSPSAIEDLATQAVERFRARFPGYTGLIEIIEGGSGTTAGAQAFDQGIAITLGDLERDLSGFSEEGKDGRIDAILTEEAIHMAQFVAVRRSGDDVVQFYTDLWREFTPGQQAAAQNTYQGTFDEMPDWARAAETVRMLIQERADGRVTELTKAFSRDMSAKLLDLLRNAVEILREFVAGGQIPPRVQDAINGIEGILTEWQEIEAAEHGSMRVLGLAIRDARANDPRLTKKLARELEFATEDLIEVMDTMAPETRRPFIDAEIAAWVDERTAPKQTRTIDVPAKTRAYQILNSGDFPALTAVFQSGTKIMPRPNLISLIQARKRAGAKLTNREISLLQNNPEYDGAVFQNQFANSGPAKVAREIVGLITARQGEGTRPDVMAGYLGDGVTADEMWQRIGAELNAIANGTSLPGTELDPNRERTEAEVSDELARAAKAGPERKEQQAENFAAANQPDAGTPIPVEDFRKAAVGGTVTVDGEEMRITKVIMDSLGLEADTIVLDDHLRFGRQVLDSGEVIYAESAEVGERGLGSSPIEGGRFAPVDLPDAVVAYDLGTGTKHPDYAAAKAGDPAAALRMAREMVQKPMLDAVRKLIGETKPLILPVLAMEEGGNNMIPAMVAEVLAHRLGLETNTDILQSVKAHRGGKSALDRVFAPVAFDGPVDAGRAYLLVDDTLTQGGTFAALADHISRHGGTVAGAVALTGKQYSATLRLSEGLLGELRAKFGDVESDFRRATGYGYDRLTESEARALARFRPADGVRERILAEGNEGGEQVGEGGTGEGPSLSSSPVSELPSGGLAEKTEQAASLTDTSPTEAQTEAGNYRKGKVSIQGMRISIENPRGSTRSGVDSKGRAWSVEMPHHYGYILGTEARDGDHVDAFIGPDPESSKVWVVNQVRVPEGGFDEHKVMIGFGGRKEAIEGYRASYSPGWRGIGDVVETDIDGFKRWLESGNTKKPFRGAPALASSPTPSPDAPAAVDAALAVMPPIYRQVFEAVNGGATPAQVTNRFRITEKAVENILNAVRSRIAAATTAASPDGLKPQMKDGKFDGGRPDLALSGNATVAAIDQIRNESDVPGVRPWDEVNAAADRMLSENYAAAYEMVLGKARRMEQMTDVETAAAKKIIAKETLAGKIQTPEDRVKLAMLIHGYRDIGTETARALAMRRDPKQRPAERHALFIAEALFSPDPQTRERMRKASKKDQQAMLEGWMARVDAIKSDLLAQGIDIDAALARHRETESRRSDAEKAAPQHASAIETAVSKLTKREKTVIQSIRDGALISQVEKQTGFDKKEILDIYGKFLKSVKDAMRDTAKRYVENTLAASPVDPMDAILAELGFHPISMIDDTVAGFKDRRNEKPRAAREPKKEKVESQPPTTEQQAKWDQLAREFFARPMSTWRTLWQDEMRKLDPVTGKNFDFKEAELIQPWKDLWQKEMPGVAWSEPKFKEWAGADATRKQAVLDLFKAKINEIRGTWQKDTQRVIRGQGELMPESAYKGPVNDTRGEWSEDRPFSGQGELIREAINETTGTFQQLHKEDLFIGSTVDAKIVMKDKKADWRAKYTTLEDGTLLKRIEGKNGKVTWEVSAGTFDLNDPIQVKAVLDAFALARGSKMDALMEYWRASILTGPQTHIVNIGSNLINAAYNLLPKRAAEAAINNLLGLVGQGSERAATFKEFAPMAKQLRAGLQLAARNALRSWKLESRTFEAYALAEPIQLDFTGVGAEYIPPALGGKFGKIMRSLSFRAMTAADEFMKSAYGQMEAAAQAHRIAAVEEKLTGSVYEARLAELMEPGSQAWARAVDESKRVTFQEEIKGEDLRSIRRLDQLAQLAKHGRNMPWIGRPLTFFLPFIDTPLNVFKQALEMSPIGGALAVIDGARALKRKVLRGSMSKEQAAEEAALLYDRARLVRDMTNQTLGVATFLALQGLVVPDEDDELPVVTGTVPYKGTKRGERDNAYAVMPAQSIRIGSLQFSYARVEPFATFLASTVDLIREMDRHGGMKPEVFSQWLMRFKDQVKDKTFLQGVSDLFNALEDPDRFAERLAANVLTGFAPNLIRQPIREMNSTIRDTNPKADEGVMTSIGRRIGYGILPQLAPAKTDVWGNEVRANRGELIGGFGATDMIFRILDPTNAQLSPKIDPLDRWIFLYNLRTADSADRISIQAIPNVLRGTVPGEKKSRTFALTPEEQAEANRLAGQQARQMLGDGWEDRAYEDRTARMIVDTIGRAQGIQREIIRNRKIAEIQASGPERE